MALGTRSFRLSLVPIPRNHHLAAFVREKLSDSRKERFVYISHEHKDHFDPAFLNSLQSESLPSSFHISGDRLFGQLLPTIDQKRSSASLMNKKWQFPGVSEAVSG